MINIDKINAKKIILIITCFIIFTFFLFDFKDAIVTLNVILNIINPFIYGFFIAYILNIIVKFFDRRLKIKNNNKKRIISIIFTLLIIALFITIILLIFIPRIIDIFNLINTNIPKFTENIKNWYDTFLAKNESINKLMKNNRMNFDKVYNNFIDYFKKYPKGFIGSSINSFNNAFYTIINLFLGFIISIVLLKNKEKVIRFIKNKFKVDKKISHILKVLNIKFEKYFVGQFFEALIIGILIFILMIIFRLKYAFSISIIISILSLVPMFGSAIALIIGIILMLTVSFKSLIKFLILYVIVQFIEGNFIRPKLIENRLKIPGIIIFLTLTISGINFGIIGLIISIPIVSTFYDLYIKDK